MTDREIELKMIALREALARVNEERDALAGKARVLASELRAREQLARIAAGVPPERRAAVLGALGIESAERVQGG